jgi:hypothetical protein
MMVRVGVVRVPGGDAGGEGEEDGMAGVRVGFGSAGVGNSSSSSSLLLSLLRE